MKLKKLNEIRLHTMISIYGPAGSGKTSLVNSMKGSVLIIDTDRGLASIDNTRDDIAVAECSSFADVMEALGYAEEFDNIVIDHLTNVQELCYKQIMTQQNVKKMQIQHYGEASQLLRGIIDTLVDLSYEGKQVLALSQEKSINIEDTISEDVPQRIVPNLMESVYRYLLASSRICGHSERVTKKKFVKGEKKTKDVYQIRVAGNPIYDLKVTRKQGVKIPDVVEKPTVPKLVQLVFGENEEEKE